MCSHCTSERQDATPPLRHSATTRRRIVHVGLADLRDVQVDLAMLTLTSRTVRIAEILDALAVFKPCNPS